MTRSAIGFVEDSHCQVLVASISSSRRYLNEAAKVLRVVVATRATGDDAERAKTVGGSDPEVEVDILDCKRGWGERFLN